ncbi:MAG: DegT/DnrJ/EryC1/StrS family aminotransferase [Phycisphaerae bacterium]|nr:DegT/DnrJ/EryC1/StrS family aminotransferase [Phycisphaerae bacterium]
MKVPLLDLKEQYETIRAEVEPAVLELMASQMFVLGKPVAQLEETLAAHSNCAFGIGVSSGTDALLCALMAMDIGYGDEVIIPTFTFFASAGVVARTGATPIFVDIDPETFNLDLEKTKAAITSKTKAIMPVHLYGQMVDMKPLMAIAKEHNIKVVEDACQSIGSEQNGERPGEIGDCACLSFYPSKNLSAFGDGGMILTQSEEFAQKCKYMRMHGEDQRYYHSMIGGNFRLDAFQAMILNIKFKYLDGWAQKRRDHAAIFNRLLCDEVKTPVIKPGNTSVYNQYVIRAPRRDELQAYLAEHEVGSGIYYPVPLHLQECFKHLGGKVGDCPVAEQACKEVLALPVYPELADEKVIYAAGCINDFYKK